MPWTGPQFRKHNHNLSPAQAAHASHIANAVLRRSGDEGMAIAVANKHYHRDAGGGLGDDPTGGIAGVAPSAQTMNPLVQGQIQRYASLPTEKLAELQARVGNSSQGQLIGKLLMQRRLVGAQNPDPGQSSQQQAPTAQKRGGATPRRDAGGGMMSASEATPWWTRREATGGDHAPTLGYLNGNTPGRADAVKTTAPAGSYVIPADVVSGLGEGNSLAGARKMEEIIRTGPHGIPLPRGGSYHGPRSGGAPHQFADGGGEASQTPVALSHGEYVCAPHHVARWGGGDIKAGHRRLDAWVVTQRKRLIKKLKSLPGPVKT